MPETVSFREAAEIIRRHGPEFGGKGVVGVGIADRNDALRFVVAVEDVKTRERLSRQYADRKVGDFPVHVEVGKVESIGALATPSGAVRPRLDIIQEIIDRPGIPLIAGLVLVGLVFFVIAR